MSRLSRLLASRPLHLWALWSLAVAQPLFDLLGRTPELFVARQLGAAGLWLLAGVLLLALPGLLVLVAELAGRALGAAARGSLYLAFLGLAAALLAALFLRRVPALPGLAALLIAVLLGALFAALYQRRAGLRQALAWLAPLTLAVPVLFLGFSPAARLLGGATPDETTGSGLETARAPERPATVVVVVFDELPTTSLLAGENEIDGELFPAFAELAATSTWYRRATTVATLTVTALPAILSGNYPRADQVATREHHPRSLFTLLAPHYRLHALEPRTAMAPPDARAAPAASPAERAALLASDLGVVYLHLLLKDDLARHLPDVTTQWDAFGKALDKADDFRRMLEAVRRDERPGLYFLHSELPHHPWIYLPSGKRYATGGELFMDGLAPGRGPASGRWLDDEWLVTQAQQRHLLQARFTDRLLGELIARLRAEGLWHEALVAVTADHGIGFVAGGHVRKVAPENLEGVMAVPLFLKLPGQREGRLELRDAELVDLLPTIADALGVELEAPVDGRSLLAEDTVLAEDTAPRRRRFIYHQADYQLAIPEERIFPRPSPTLERRLARFGPRPGAGTTGGDAERRLFRIGPHHRELVGRRPASLGPTASSLRAEIDDRHHYQEVDLGAEVLPARVSGRLAPLPEAPEGAALALAVGGVVEATAPLVVAGEQAGSFAFMVPEKAFRDGRNELALFLVRPGDDGGPRLEPVALEPPVDYRLVGGGRGGRIAASSGETWTLEPGRFEGEVVDVVYAARAFRVELIGWAREAASGAPAERIVVFADGELLHSGHPNLDRPELARRYVMRGREEAGFVFFLPRERFGGEVRVFALGEGGQAAELAYEPRLAPQEHEAF